jgi:hypothetical protein
MKHHPGILPIFITALFVVTAVLPRRRAPIESPFDIIGLQISNHPPKSRGIAMCAHDAYTLRLAWTQIMALKTLYKMNNESFVVFHADELADADLDVANAMASLRALPNVKVINLLTWHQATYENDSHGLMAFKGYFCKVGALLAAPYDIVGVIDLDVVLMANPFLLLGTDIFQSHGHYLFRDRRTTPSQRTNEYIAELKRMWAQFHPERLDNVSSALAQSPPFSGWSHDYGESAAVFMDKSQNADALAILEQMAGHSSLTALGPYVHGDKESYWQALAMADREVGMNPSSWAAAGSRNTNGEACCHQDTLAQWLWLRGHQPQIFYLNGDGIEKLISGEKDTLFRS